MEELTIEPLKIDPEKPNEVREKVNEMVDILNSLIPAFKSQYEGLGGIKAALSNLSAEVATLDSEVKELRAEVFAPVEVIEEPATQTEIVNSVPRVPVSEPRIGVGFYSDNWWRPVNGGEMLWMPPVGSVVRIEEVPPLLLDHFMKTGKVLNRQELEMAEEDAIKSRQ